MKQDYRHSLKKRMFIYGLFSISLIPTLAIAKLGDTKVLNPSNLIEIGDGNNLPQSNDPRLRFPENDKLQYGEIPSVTPKMNLVMDGGNASEADPTYPPIYFNDFQSPEKWNEMTVLDANGDSKQFEVNAKGDTIYYYQHTWHHDAKSQARVWALDIKDIAMDDWLFTPQIELEAGKKYQIKYKARCGMPKWPERMEVFIGNDTTVAGMTNRLCEPFILNRSAYDEGGAYYYPIHDFTPTTSGKYIVGFHACSDPNTYTLILDDIAVSEYIAVDAPAGVTDMVVTPDANYDTRATITCKAPLKNLGEKDLKGNVNLVLVRDDVTVDTLKNIAPGAEGKFVDEPAKPGTVKYSVRAINEYGESPNSTVELFVGVNLPANVPEISFVEDGNTGKVTATWTAVTTDVDGNTIPEDKVRYNVYDLQSSSRKLMAENVRGTSATFQLVNPGYQNSKRLAIWAVTAYGESKEGQPSTTAFVGTPYNGFAESFANASLGHDIIASKENGSASVGLGNDGRFADYKSADDDNGYIYFAFSAYNDRGSMSFGKVSLKNIAKPTLTFYTYNVVSGAQRDVNLIEVRVKELGADKYTVATQGTIDALCQGLEGWGRITVDLSAYAGKDIEFQIAATARAFTLVFLDDIRIEQLREKDLKAHAITAPSKVNPGAKYNVDVTVANDGHAKATGYDVNLYCDGAQVATVKGADLEPARRAVVSFPLTLSMLSEKKMSYYAEVKYDGDEKTTNNTTKSVLIQPVVSRLPQATTLTAATANEGVSLNWNEPVYQDGIPETVTEDFETATAWELKYDDWTFVDLDNSPVGGIAGVPFPGIYLNQTKVGFFVVDNTTLPYYFADRFMAHSGTQYIGALLRYDANESDDWAISPTLSGNKQTISFWTKSVLPNHLDVIDVLWSTGSLDPDDFIETNIKNDSIQAAWTNIKVEIPQGAKYFAIRNHSHGGMLLIDDVTFERVYNRNLTLKGYNVYRNDDKVNTDLVATCEYVDNNAPGGNHSYRVTAVYDKGESMGSNSAEISVAGIGEIAAGAKVGVYPGKGFVTVTGADGENLTIYNLAGATVYSNVVSANTTVNLEAGVYLLKVGSQTYKIMIK